MPAPLEREDLYVGPPRFSASQIDTYLSCPRKWAWDRIAKIPRRTAPSAALGTRMHSHLEHWLTTGEAPLLQHADGTADQAAEMATLILDDLPPPMDLGLEVEKSFSFESPRTGFIYRGFIDWRHPFWPDDIPTVGDHKSTSDIDRYAKSEQDLATDPQAIIYAVDTMAEYKAARVRLQWTYSQSTARKSLPVITEFDADHAASAFEALEDVATEMAGYLGTVSKDEVQDKVPAVDSQCWKYGKCPYFHVCDKGHPFTPDKPFSFGTVT